MIIKFKRTDAAATIPKKANPTDAGFDLYTPVPFRIIPGDRRLCPLGFKMALPEGYEAQIRPRSGLAHKHGLTVLNSPGTVDAKRN